ncbi:MAG: hypothetical protein GHCLOJNM_04615 [bacterium]|nr:hypothetical protein [bacterium]
MRNTACRLLPVLLVALTASLPVFGIDLRFSGRKAIDHHTGDDERYPSRLPREGAYLKTVDFDADGDEDIITDWAVFNNHNSNPPAFSARFETTTVCITDVGDIDTDGDLDLVYTGGWIETTGPSLNLFVSHVVDSTAGIIIGASDINSDNFVDLLAVKNGSESFILSWLENLGGPAPGFKYHMIDSATDQSINHIILADMNGDHRPDIVASTVSRQTFRWYENLHSGNFARHDILTEEYPRDSFKAFDMDGDGKLDLVGAISAIETGSRVGIWRNGGEQPPVFRLEMVRPVGWRLQETITPVDLDFDRDVDFLSSYGWGASYYNASTDSQYLETRLEDPPWFYTCYFSNVYSECNEVSGDRASQAMDIDGDGDLDILECGTVTESHCSCNFPAQCHCGSLTVADLAWYENIDGPVRNIQILDAKFLDGNQDETFEQGEEGYLLVEVWNEALVPVGGEIQIENETSFIDFPLGKVQRVQLDPGEEQSLVFDYLISPQAPCGERLTADVRLSWASSSDVVTVSPETIGRMVTLWNSYSETGPFSQTSIVTRRFTISPKPVVLGGLEYVVEVLTPAPEFLEVILTSRPAPGINVFLGRWDPYPENETSFTFSGSVPAWVGKQSNGVVELIVNSRNINYMPQIGRWGFKVVFRQAVCADQVAAQSPDFHPDGALNHLDLFMLQSVWADQPSPRFLDLNLDGRIGPWDLLRFLGARRSDEGGEEQ